jgi:hypothetical protein
VKALLIPMPEDDAVQHAFADTAALNRTAAQTVKRKVEDDWQAPKGRFGDALVN